MNQRIGYIVIEYRQTTAQPCLDPLGSTLHHDVETARLEAAELEDRAWRGERFRVAAVTLLPDEMED